MTSPPIVVPVLLAFLVAAPHLASQTEFVRGDYFPADLEFVELQSIQSEQTLDRTSGLTDLPEGLLVAEVGFKKYDRRTYTIKPSGTLSIEVFTLKDAKAAYSLITVLQRTSTANGPPGDLVSFDGSNLMFSQANILVRVQSDAPGDLSSRVARSVSNRIARHEPAPLLLSHLPKTGYDAKTLRYFLGPRSLAKYAQPVAGKELRIEDEVEIAQARYTLEEQNGILSLIGFPTGQLADEYYNRFFALVGSQTNPGQRLYFKKAGPILGVLEGSFNPVVASKILGSIEFRY